MSSKFGTTYISFHNVVELLYIIKMANILDVHCYRRYEWFRSEWDIFMVLKYGRPHFGNGRSKTIFNFVNIVSWKNIAKIRLPIINAGSYLTTLKLSFNLYCSMIFKIGLCTCIIISGNHFVLKNMLTTVPFT